jgi:hypothetical protein
MAKKLTSPFAPQSILSVLLIPRYPLTHKSYTTSRFHPLDNSYAFAKLVVNERNGF